MTVLTLKVGLQPPWVVEVAPTLIKLVRTPSQVICERAPRTSSLPTTTPTLQVSDLRPRLSRSGDRSQTAPWVRVPERGGGPALAHAKPGFWL